MQKIHAVFITEYNIQTIFIINLCCFSVDENTRDTVVGPTVLIYLSTHVCVVSKTSFFYLIETREETHMKNQTNRQNEKIVQIYQPENNFIFCIWSC